MFDEEADTITEELEPLMITGDLDAAEPTHPGRDPIADSSPFAMIEDDLLLLGPRAATNAAWPPTPRVPGDHRRAITTL